MDTIRGYVEHIIFHNDENGYTVMTMTVDSDELTCVGSFRDIHEGVYVEAEGSFSVHPVYGHQFRAVSAKITVPAGGAALERYLGSGAIKGVGPSLAGRIVKKFGEDTLRILEEEPERLAEVKGISEKKARDIAAQTEEKAHMQNAMIFLAQYGISLAMSVKIYEQYQDQLYQVLKENPYRLAEDIRGIGFRIADEIAHKVGIRPDSEFRIRSGLCYILSQAGAQGHLYLPADVLLRQASELLGTGAEEMEKYLMDLAIDRKIVIKTAPGEEEEPQRLVYSAQAYHLELNAARMLYELNLLTGEDEDRVDARIRALEKKDRITLDPLQREAVRKAACCGLLIVTGGPGTGKTTTINTMIRYFRAEKKTVSLAAPTGRAAKRMTEATGYEAATIHRLLELSAVSDDTMEEIRFERNADNPLESDVIIIDEMSMVDMYLMHALLLAVAPGTRLILVGDRNQLPSVGPGSVLRDLIRSDCFPVVTLTHIFRQAQESDIVVNAHRINAGQPVRLDNNSRDFFFLRRNEAEVIRQAVLYLVSKKLPGYVKASPAEIQVLTPTRKGPLGVESLNALLQSYLNPPDRSKAEKETAKGLFREGDRVMQIRNNYQLEWEIRGRHGIPVQQGCGLFNGDVGFIRRIDLQNEMMEVEYEEGKIISYTFRQLDELELAYAMTVHKAQGSEYPAVVIPLLGVPQMLQTRNLLYTAVTRAKKCVVLTGSADIFQAMVDHATEEMRYTTLAERIREIAGIESGKMR